MNSSLSKKNRIIIVVAYLILSMIISSRKQHYFSLIYFAAVGIVDFLSYKFLKEDLFNEKPLAVAFFAAISHNTMYELFYTTHGNLEQLMTAFAIAIFFAGIFAATDTARLPYCIFAVPVLCFLNLRIAICYSVLLLSISLVYLQVTKYSSKTKKKKDEKFSKKSIAIISIAICITSLAICIYLALKPTNQIKENFTYYLTNYKNNLAVAVVSVYLLIKLIKRDFELKVSMLIGLLIQIAVAIFATVFLAFSALSLSLLCIAALLAFCCLQSNGIVEEIKTDYQNNKYLFWVLIICLLQ